MAFLDGELVDNQLPNLTEINRLKHRLQIPFVNLFHRVPRQPVFSRDMLDRDDF